MFDLSIIIVSYNTCDLLRDCLGSINGGCTGLQVETIVVDNDSSDNSVQMVEREFPDVELIVSKINAGFAAANNMAIDKATGRYLVLLNPDTVVHAGALTELVRFMDATPSCGYCGPRLLNADGTHQPSARRFPTALSCGYSSLGWGHRFPASRHTLDLHLQRSDQTNFRTDWVTGACLMARAQAVRDIGLLDSGYFMYFEETDWCRRMADAGWEGWYVASATVTHLGGQSVVHQNDVRPFSGDHPVHWVNSSRRYMRRHVGWVGYACSVAIQVVLYALIWLRHRWRSGEQSRHKAKIAAATINFLLTRSPSYDRSAS